MFKYENIFKMVNKKKSYLNIKTNWKWKKNICDLYIYLLFFEIGYVVIFC